MTFQSNQADFAVMPLESNKHPYSSLALFSPSMNLMVSMAYAFVFVFLQQLVLQLVCTAASNFQSLYYLAAQWQFPHLLVYSMQLLQVVQVLQNLKATLLVQARGQHQEDLLLLDLHIWSLFWKIHLGFGMHNLFFTIFVQNHCYSMCFPILFRKLWWWMKMLSFLIQLFLHCFPGLSTNKKKKNKIHFCNWSLHFKHFSNSTT